MFEPPYEMDSREVDAIASPSLIVFRELLDRNIETMIALVGGDVERLRPHCKTHKMPAVIDQLRRRGITQHKCATIAEAEMLARAGAADVLVAYPLVGPNVRRFVSLIRAFPGTRFRALVDDESAAARLAAEAEEQGLREPIPALVDIDVGMGRTGVGPEGAPGLYRLLAASGSLVPDGLHLYDGHARGSDPVEREAVVAMSLEVADGLTREIRSMGLEVGRIVMGGSPTFPMHARRARAPVECSPGTLLFHDHGYATRYPDLPFEPAALLLTRVISRPGEGRICLDAGHKAVAADPEGDRLSILGLERYRLGSQSEEHLVVETDGASSLEPGAALLAIPTHICPTVALHARALVVAGGRVVDQWDVAARDRMLSI